MTSPAVAVNGRFLGRPITGVERYAGELTRRLQARLGDGCVVLRPDRAASGARGHAWEQLALPFAFRRSGAPVLVSLCNLGPVTVRSQLVVIHDVSPFLLRDAFTPAYRAQVRAVQWLLARRCRVATDCELSRKDLAEVLRLDVDDVALLPPAVGPPFQFPDPGTGGRACVFVGGHDERKNLRFLLPLWPEVHRRTGLELHVAGRSSSATLRGGATQALDGVAWHLDLDDRALAQLYRGALCVLSPSRYEGFGLPLLEGMACGTPFLATNTGAAAEFAVEPEQILPLDEALWVERLRAWAERDLTALRAASLERAGLWTWDATAGKLLELVRALA